MPTHTMDTAVASFLQKRPESPTTNTVRQALENLLFAHAQQHPDEVAMVEGVMKDQDLPSTFSGLKESIQALEYASRGTFSNYALNAPLTTMLSNLPPADLVAYADNVHSDIAVLASADMPAQAPQPVEEDALRAFFSLLESGNNTTPQSMQAIIDAFEKECEKSPTTNTIQNTLQKLLASHAALHPEETQLIANVIPEEQAPAKSFIDLKAQLEALEYASRGYLSSYALHAPVARMLSMLPSPELVSFADKVEQDLSNLASAMDSNRQRQVPSVEMPQPTPRRRTGGTGHSRLRAAESQPTDAALRAAGTNRGTLLWQASAGRPTPKKTPKFKRPNPSWKKRGYRRGHRN